jgi:ribosomal protein L37AE/L43A|tara:strand:- start:558 stop:1109 length:552 start_codon:yes stop_codon:yes gene_type:complete
MAGYSRESERQNKALKAILRGDSPDKRIMVASVDREFKDFVKKEREDEQKRVDEKLEATKEARLPWFCPDCKRIMKRRLDERMWYLHGHCFECQVEVENKMMIDGTFDEWEDKKVNANKLAWIRDKKQELVEFKNQKDMEAYNQVNPDGHSLEKEKWTQNFDELKKQAGEAIEHLEKIEESLK